MRMEYYVSHILPMFVEAIQTTRIDYDTELLLRRDENSTHGTCGDADHLIWRYLRETWTVVLLQPAQSLDLDSQEVAYNNSKERVKLWTWRTIRELRAIIRHEWKEIKQH